MKKGKKYQDSVKLIEANTLYDANEALELVEKTAKAKFDETVEMHMKLGVDGRHADQQVRGAIVLPNGTGKSVREVTGLGLADAKAAVEGAPTTLKEAVSKEDGEEIKAKIEGVGGKVALK